MYIKPGMVVWCKSPYDVFGLETYQDIVFKSKVPLIGYYAGLGKVTVLDVDYNNNLIRTTRAFGRKWIPMECVAEITDETVDLQVKAKIHKVGVEVEHNPKVECGIREQDYCSQVKIETSQIHEHNSHPYNIYSHQFLDLLNNIDIQDEYVKGYYDLFAGSMHTHISFTSNLILCDQLYIDSFLLLLPFYCRKIENGLGFFRSHITSAANIHKVGGELNSKQVWASINTWQKTLEIRMNEHLPLWVYLVEPLINWSREYRYDANYLIEKTKNFIKRHIHSDYYENSCHAFPVIRFFDLICSEAFYKKLVMNYFENKGYKPMIRKFIERFSHKIRKEGCWYISDTKKIIREAIE